MKSPLVFRVYKKDQIHVVKQFVDDDRIIIGRGADVHIDLESAEISAIHCLVEKRGAQFYICDLGSAQGTFKNGRQILDEPIDSGDSFQIGPFTVFFFIGAPKNATVPPERPAAAAAPVQSPDVPLRSAPAPSARTATAAVAAVAVWSSRKGKKTFAPPSQFTDLKDHLKVGAGQRVEVIVSWRERILNTYHFASTGSRTLGETGDISVPEGSAPRDWKLLDMSAGVVIRTSPEMKVEVLRDGQVSAITSEQYKLNQSEACFIQLINGMQIVIRFAPKAPPLLFDSPLILGASEFTGILAALIIAVLASLIVSVNKPKPAGAEEDVERIAQVIFATPPPPEPPPLQVPPPAVEKNIEEQAKTKEMEETKKAQLLDAKKESRIYGDPVNPQNKAQAAQQAAGKAAEVKPKDPQLKTKMFTSTKQGGAVKTGDTTGANTQSKEPDPSSAGLLAAFGEGGARSKLDQVYSGAGELIGTAEKAKGVSGFGAVRDGDDLGTQFKDTGAGGEGTATQGIAGVGTKGRGAGMSGYGSGTGFGDKDRVQITGGGSEEAFTGSIDREAVRRAVRSALPQFKACYEREYRINTKLEGKVVITWEIHERGLARNARVVHEKSTIGNSAVEECVRSRMLGIRFPEPPPGTAAEVTYPFVFQGQKL